MGAFNQLNGAIFDAGAIEARISAVDGKSIYNQRDGATLSLDLLARRLTALDGKVAVGQGGTEFDVDSFMRRLAAIEAGLFTPLSLFALGEQGAWYDPSDFTTMWQDSAGTTPVTAAGQPVGLLLDKRLGLTVGPELLESGAPNGTGWSFSSVDAAAETATTITFATQFANRMNPTPTVAGSVYVYTFQARTITGNTALTIFTEGSAGGDTRPITLDGTLRTYTAYALGNAASGAVNFGIQDRNAAGFGQIEFHDASVRLVTGNHATQATTTMRALVSSGLGETFDGVDDADAAVAGGASTTGFFYCASLNVVGGAASARTLWSDTGTNTGYRVRINASNQLEIAAGNGTTYTTVATSGTLNVGTSYVVTAWHDGVNLNAQINKGAVASGAFGAVTAGTAGFTEAKDNGASTSPANVTLFTRIYRQTVPTANQISQAQTYVGAKAGVVL